MPFEQVVRAALWALASVAGIVVSFVSAQVNGTDPTTILLGAAGLVGLVGLIWKLVGDYRSTSELIDDYRASLEAERNENRALRVEIDALRNRPVQ